MPMTTAPTNKFRRDRLKKVWEARRDALHAFNEDRWNRRFTDPYGDPHVYSSLVIKYTRARRAWRRFRGWE